VPNFHVWSPLSGVLVQALAHLRKPLIALSCGGIERARGASGKVSIDVSLSQKLDQLQTDVLSGKLTRRATLKRGLALGLSAPVIAGLLAACGGSASDTPAGGGATAPAGGATAPAGGATAPAGGSAGSGQAGGSGTLRLLWWQAPTILNPHLSTGTKDSDGSRIFYEPLADFDTDGNMFPVLATEAPTLDNGGVSKDGLSITWKLREGVKWHDGKPFTADDVVFTWEYASNPATSAVTQGIYSRAASVEKVDDLTVKVSFAKPSPGWYDLFVGPNGGVLPKHVFGDYVGEKSRDASANLAPVGTGPFKLKEFRAGDTVWGDRFVDYWDAGKPHFDSVEMKGGGDSQGAARAVLQSGEADWAWNLQVEPSVLAQMEQGGAGILFSGPGASSERVMINFADPNKEVDGARSEPSTQHPIFKNKDARNAIALSVQRDVIVEQLYGKGGTVTPNNLNTPPQFVSPNTTWEYNIDKAKELLAGVPEAAGYKLLFQTSINSVRQKTQEIIKQSLEKVAFKVELKSIDGSVFFSSDAGNPDTNRKFYADLQMYTNGPDSPYPIAWARRFRSDEICQKSNSWAATNVTRYNNPEFDKLHDQAQVEMDPAKQAELFIAMNDLTVNDFVEVPIVHRGNLIAVSKTLEGYSPAAFMSDVYDMKNWSKKA